MTVNRAMLALLVFGAALGPAWSAPTAFTPQDLVRLERVSDVAVSPDGRRVVYGERSTDMEANKGRTGLFMLDTGKRGAAPQRLTDGDVNAGSAEWSSDGRFIYFLSNRSGSSQVWRAMPGAEPTQVTRLPLDVGSFHVAPAGGRLVVSLEVFIDCPDLGCTTRRLEARSKDKATGVAYDQLFIRHWDTWSDGRRAQLFALTLNEDGTTPAMPILISGGIGDVPGKPFGGREDFAFSPNGARLTFAARAVAGEPWSTNFDLYEVVLGDSSAPRNLTADNQAWDAQPAYSPDGTQLAYLAMDRPGFEADRFHLVLLDVRTGTKRHLTQGWDRSIANFAWSRDGRTLFATADHLGQRPLWSIDVKSGRATQLTLAGEVESFSVGTAALVYSASSLGSPADLYSIGTHGGTAARLTQVNQPLLSERSLGEYEQFSFGGWNHENVFGYVMKPVDFKPGQKYPIAFVVHGGPQGSFGNSWSYRWNAQAFAAAGYAVVFIDFHGSTGYGQAFTDSISGDWGGKPLVDLQQGFNAALKLFPWLDGDRACALGASYGGYMMNWIAGRWPDRFRCIVSHDGIFDLRSMYYSTDELWFAEHEFGGPEFQNSGGYAKFNPADFVTRWKTPMLVIHGGQDFRVPDAQGIGTFTALQRQGVPSRFLYFPNENHWVLKPADSEQWYAAVLEWMGRWTKP
jgi:dipeptidyl aminopeptidase/acylaminoacyl peptidase